MNISKKQLDTLNAEINITLDQADFQPKVDTILADYKKTANVPGFRKGHVPMGMIKKTVWKVCVGRRGKQTHTREFKQLPNRREIIYSRKPTAKGIGGKF